MARKKREVMKGNSRRRQSRIAFDGCDGEGSKKPEVTMREEKDHGTTVVRGEIASAIGIKKSNPGKRGGKRN